MATKNDVTGDALVSRTPSDKYKVNHDQIFGKLTYTVKISGFEEYGFPMEVRKTVFEDTDRFEYFLTHNCKIPAEKLAEGFNVEVIG